jgi:hypothetical protein
MSDSEFPEVPTPAETPEVVAHTETQDGEETPCIWFSGQCASFSGVDGS